MRTAGLGRSDPAGSGPVRFEGKAMTMDSDGTDGVLLLEQIISCATAEKLIYPVCAYIAI
jgi:hypothetical protein